MTPTTNKRVLYAALRDLGLDEVMSEYPVNRLEAEKTTPDFIKETDLQPKIINPSPDIPKTPSIRAVPQLPVVADEARMLADAATTLEALRETVQQFEGCSLKKTATHTVFCDGNPNAEIMVVGEAPGQNEDLTGIPFCGESGQLLDAMFAAIGLNRTTLYITNTIFWRPPGNRKPTPEEVAMCQAFGEKHIALIRPKLLLLVGATAAQSFLSTEEPMSLLRGRTHFYQNRYLSAEIPCFVLYHPSYLLRQPGQKKQAWIDLQKINNFMKESLIR